MRIQIASDLHLEAYESRLPPVSAFRPVSDRDLLVLAGDIGTGMLAREFVLRELTRSPVIYVPGNHEYYGFALREEIDDDWRDTADSHAGLHYLVGETAEIDGVRFWGAPWYSDLWGRREPRTVAAITRGIHDFAYPPFRPWRVGDHLAAHAAQTEQLEAVAGQVDVVVTHWPPTRRAMHPKYEGDGLNPYFYNDADELVCQVGARLWISGHTHESWDCQVGGTRCLGNPSGYRGDQQQSPHFRPNRVVEVERWGDTPGWERPYIPPAGIREGR